MCAPIGVGVEPRKTIAATKPKPQEKDETYRMPWNRHNIFMDHVMPVIGACMMLCLLPLLVPQIAFTTLWGKKGPSVPGFYPALKKVARACDSISTSGKDGEIVLWATWLGVGLPLLWLYVAYHQSVVTLVLYNVVRIGPMYVNFAHVYTLAHMEAHRRYKLFTLSRENPVSGIFNWLCGLFHGVVPATFTESHIANHHRWHNDFNDVYSTAGYRRDSVWNFMRYVPVWMMYASNMSSMWYFHVRKDSGRLQRTVFGTLYYVAFVFATQYMFGTTFALATIVYPFFEGNVLLAMVNYVWHMFLDTDQDNHYVNSITIEDGEEFIFSEEYHVVHHATPGIDHSKYRAEFEKNLAKYDIIFKNENLFELGGTAMARDYERLTDMVKENGMPRAEVTALLKKRLTETWW